jgi:hypothetical protein
MSMENCGGYDIDRVKLLIHPSELASNPSSSHMAAKQREWAKGMMNLALLSIFVHTCK